MGGESGTPTHAETTSVSRLRGHAFRCVSLVATLFGIAVVSGLLLYVANDALRPATADRGWHVTVGTVLGLPTVALVGYYIARDRTAGRVAYETLGILTVGLISAGGLMVLFSELTTPIEWLAFLIGLAVGCGVIVGHARLRPAAALERLIVAVLAPLLALFGVPAISIQQQITLPLSGTDLFFLSLSSPQLLPSVPELVLLIPIMPVDWMLLVATVTVPVSYAFGRIVSARRHDDRGRRELVAGAVIIAVVAAFVAPLAGLFPGTGVLLATALVVPSAAYLEGVVRRGKGLVGLAFPVVVVAGSLVAVVITGMLGFAGPNAWLDWGFLTSATSRNPADAGIYPALVGSVLIVLVIAVSAFPVGVGAAIYLEEYAPRTGRLARFVELVEINIGNLAGVPSIVYGLLGLALFVQGIGLESGIVIVGGLTVGLLVLPIVIISAQEAVRAVPDSRRQASYGVGATRWQTTRDVVLPEALPGILTGTILALGRAIGETAPLLMIGVASSVRMPPGGLFSKTGAMPRQIFSWSSEIQPEFRYGVLAAGVIVLVGVLLLMNGTAIILRNRYQRTDQ